MEAIAIVVRKVEGWRSRLEREREVARFSKPHRGQRKFLDDLAGEKWKAFVARFSSEQRRAMRLESRKRYYYAHLDENKARCRDNYERHRDERIAYSRRYASKNRERRLAYRRARYAELRRRGLTSAEAASKV